MPFTILILCAGNICRSPLAEAVLSTMLEGQSRIVVTSAGLEAPVGVRPDPKAVAVAQAMGFEISPDKRSRRVVIPELRAAQMILVMEKVHKQDVQARLPTAAGKTFLLGHWQEAEIADPVGREVSFFTDIGAAIELGCRAWAKQITELKIAS